jgi:hypothetical protein
MNKPFENILTNRAYRLKYYVNGNEIAKCIEETFEQFGEDIKKTDFNKMITKLKSNGKRSVLTYKSQSLIITNICKYFSSYLNERNIDKIIKCFNKSYYP